MIPSKSQFLQRISFRILICALVTLVGLTAMAQSGRRSVTGSPSVKPPAPPEEPKQSEKKPANKDQLDLIVGTNRGDVFAGIPNYFYDSVLTSCSRRLNDARSLKVNVVSKSMERVDAINSAKAAKQGFVVWLQLRSDGMNGYTPGDLSTVRIDYWVFEAITARVKTQGTCYQGMYRSGGVILQPGTSGANNPAIAESRLIDSARDAADRILKALHISPASDIPSH